MKFFNVIVLMVLCFLNSVNARDTIVKDKIYATWTRDTSPNTDWNMFSKKSYINNSEKNSNKIYRTWITVNNDWLITKGMIYEIKDSSILVSRSLLIQDYSADKIETLNIHFNNIETIKIREKDRVRHGVLYGALTGLTIGVLTGILLGAPSCSHQGGIDICTTRGELAVGLGVPFSILGAGIGALIGSAQVVIPINGNMANFNKNKSKLKEYSFKK